MSLRGSMVPSPFVMSFPRTMAISYSVVKYLLRAYSQSIIGLGSGDIKVNKPGSLVAQWLRIHLSMQGTWV